MPYCTASDVRLLINTSLSDDDIGSLITLADAELDALLGGASMSSTLKKGCSMRLTAIMIAGRQPQQQRIGAYSEGWGGRIAEWRRWVNRAVARAAGRWHTVDPLEE